MPMFKVHLEDSDGQVTTLEVPAPGRREAAERAQTGRSNMSVRGIEKKVSGQWHVVEGASVEGTGSASDIEMAKAEGPAEHGILPRVPGEPVVGGLLKFLGGLEIVAAIIAGAVLANELPAFGIIVVVTGVVGGLLLVAAGEAVNYLHRIAWTLERIHRSSSNAAAT